MSPPARIERLRQRAALLKRIRQFFDDRGFLEVETPLLESEIIPELHIEPFRAGSAAGVTDSPATGDPATPAQLAGSSPALYLQASPELHMKRLLAEGASPIYQVTRSFRYGERGAIHNPEFTLIEWYRTGDGLSEGIELLDALCQQTAGAPAATLTTYAEAFQRHAGINPHRAACDAMAAAANRLGVSIPEGHPHDDRDEWLNLLMATVIEPQLGAAGPEILYYYPGSQSALATTTLDADGHKVAERFELYWHGIELANGYHELTDAVALRRRLELVNRQRAADDRPCLPLPETLLQAMASPGLPRCSGCALGFDRLAMLAAGAKSIDDVMAFPQRSVDPR